MFKKIKEAKMNRCYLFPNYDIDQQLHNQQIELEGKNLSMIKCTQLLKKIEFKEEIQSQRRYN